MTTAERELIKELRPRIDAGERGLAMRVYQNLTTVRRQAKKCLICGGPIVKKSGRADKKFDTRLCYQIWRSRARAGVATIAAALVLFASVAIGGELSFEWDNGDTNAVTQTVVSWGIAPGNYTASTNLPITQTFLRLTNLAIGKKYYFAARHFDGQEYSPFTKEVSGYAVPYLLTRTRSQKVHTPRLILK